MSEASVKVLKSCIQKQTETHGTDWDLYLHSTAFAIRSHYMSLHTKVSPAKIILGAELKQPVQQLLPLKPHVQAPFNQKQTVQFAQSLSDELKVTTQMVQATLQHSRDKMKEQYDKRIRYPLFDIGESVMLWYPYKRSGLSKCLQPN